MDGSRDDITNYHIRWRIDGKGTVCRVTIDARRCSGTGYRKSGVFYIVGESDISRSGLFDHVGIAGVSSELRSDWLEGVIIP